MYKNILIPTDGSELSARAVRYGVGLAKILGARVTAITVTQPFHGLSLEPLTLTDTHEEYDERARKFADQTLGEFRAVAAEAGVHREGVHVEHARPYEAILKAAQARDCDLIVMASHGRGGMAAVLLGSETLKVLTHSTIPVLVYR